ncbi:hypothetical protein LHJ74_05140 [Streptomyces sp. N2-109]|uniref:LigA protein n=1 Tax=Streptomyces gossypii TaxID=2883101 RepID=A0ABT2JP74_9ACTN|nr:hypothetical protein [Streptomyces gossypii]MCT2589324.1 hypothetical protein [Streptomyces gossypii]
MRRRHFVTGLAGATAGVGLGALPLGASAGASPDSTRAGGPAGSPATATAGQWLQSTAPPGAEASRLLKVAAAGPELAWAVGEQARDARTPGRPLALRWDGTAWSHTDVTHLGITGSISEVSGIAPDAAWAVAGDTGDGPRHLLRWDGTTWQDTAFPGSTDPGTRLRALTVAEDGRAWVAGVLGGRVRLLHWDGGVWRWLPPLPEGTPVPWNAHLAADGSVWVSGDGIARWDHKEWTVLPAPGGIRQTLVDLLPVAADDAWAVGAAFGVGGPPGKPPGVVLLRWNGTAWVSQQGLPFSVGALNSVVGDADGNPALIAGWDFWDGTRTHYLRRDGDGWSSERGPLATGETPMMLDLAAVPGTEAVWSVGANTRYSTTPPARLRIEHYG